MEPTATGGWVEPDMDVSQDLLAAQAPGAQSWSRASFTEGNWFELASQTCPVQLFSPAITRARTTG